MVNFNASAVGQTRALDQTQHVQQQSTSSTPGAIPPPATLSTIPSHNITQPADRVSRLFSAPQLAQFHQLPESSRHLLLETPFLKQQQEPLSKQAFHQVMAAAGQLETYKGSDERLQLTANALLGKTYAAGDQTVVAKALDHLSTRALPTEAKANLVKAQQAVKNLATQTDAKSHSQAYEALRDLAASMPKSDPQTLSVRQLAEQVRSGGMEQLRNEFKQSLQHQFHHLTKGGTERAVSLKFDIGPALGLFNLKAASATVGFGYDVKVTGNDDTRIRASHKGSLSVNLEAGGGETPVKVALSGSLGLGKTQAFANLDSFIDYHANDMLVMLAGEGAGKLKHNFKGMIQARRADAQMRNVVSHNQQLTKQLIQQNILGQGDKIQVKPRQSATPITAVGMSVDGSASLEAGIHALAKLKGALQGSVVHTTFTKHANLLDTLMTEPDRIESRPGKFFSVSVPLKDTAVMDLSDFLGDRQTKQGAEGRQWIQETENELKRLSTKLSEEPFGQDHDGEMYQDKLAAKRSELKDVIVALKLEYDSYLNVVNSYDAARNGGESGAIKRDLGHIKHAFEGSRGAEGRGEYLRAVMCTHAKLNQAYMASFREGEVPHLNPQEAPFSQFLKSVADDFRTPQLNLEQQKHIDKSLTLTSGAMSTNTQLMGTVSTSVQVPVLGEKTVDLGVKYNKIDGDINPDNDGEYINASLKLDIPAVKDKSSAIKGILKEGIGRFLSENSLELSEIDGLDDLALSGSLSASTQFEGNFVKGEDNKYHLQYIRATESTSLGGNASATAGVVKLGAGITHSSNDHLAEWISDNTLTYLQTKFNGWQNGQQPALWDQYASHHETGIGKAFDKLTESDSNIAKELDKRASDIPNGQHLKEALLEKAGQWKAEHNKENFQQAMGALNDYFEAQYLTYKSESAERLTPRYND
ncbi:hypothetical protein [Photobacterium alginatilyticum]|uniref:hypothetical protein n=1 Tax=Photobacterium alginatilyticum TaxID=1775171 RepID=UPI001865893E|nr:hypothetical protein [Photobacterium alginatilyticum]